MRQKGRLVTGGQMLGLLQQEEENSFPTIQDFAVLAAEQIQEALGPSCEDAEIHYRAIRLVFNTLHNHQRKYQDEDPHANDDEEGEQQEEEDENQSSVASGLRISTTEQEESQEDRCRRIRKGLNKSLPADILIEQRQERERQERERQVREQPLQVTERLYLI